MKVRNSLLWFIGLLILIGLACSQAGEVLTPAEATARASAASSDNGDSGSTFEGESYQIGDTIKLVGTNFLINLLIEPGGRIIGGQERNSTAEIVDVAEKNGVIWYKVGGSAGEGWVSEKNAELVVIETPPSAETEAPGVATEDAGTSDLTTVFTVGDTAFLTGRSFLVSLMSEPGGKLMVMGQQRGAQVTVLEIEMVDDVPWYYIDGDAGQGWVAEENLTTEAP